MENELKNESCNELLLELVNILVMFLQHISSSLYILKTPRRFWRETAKDFDLCQSFRV